MSKYIIDTNKYYLHEFDGALIVMMHEGKPVSVYESKDNLEELNSDYINEHFGSLQDEAYQAGLKDAWNVARKLAVETDDGGVSIDALYKMFGTESMCTIMKNNTVHDAIDKLKAYDGEHSDRIEVGDEVQAPCGIATVTSVKDDFVHYFYSDGDVGCIGPHSLKKTGKHYDIQSILEAMRK